MRFVKHFCLPVLLLIAVFTFGLNLITRPNPVDARPLTQTTYTLYDGTQGTDPTTQGWLLGGALTSLGIPTILDETLITNGVGVDTDGNAAEYAGYANYEPTGPSFVNASFPSLDRNPGFSISFNMTLTETTVVDPDRATFSVIAISSDGQGIELGFEDNLIFAQTETPLFTRGESVSITPFGNNYDYELRISSNGYALYVDGTLRLSGSLRDYSAFNNLTSSPPLPYDPYEQPSFIFFGDNTGQEFGGFEFYSASVTILSNSVGGVAEPIMIHLSWTDWLAENRVLLASGLLLLTAMGLLIVNPSQGR